MIDYLAGIARRAVNPAGDVRSTIAHLPRGRRADLTAAENDDAAIGRDEDSKVEMSRDVAPQRPVHKVESTSVDRPKSLQERPRQSDRSVSETFDEAGRAIHVESTGNSDRAGDSGCLAAPAHVEPAVRATSVPLQERHAIEELHHVLQQAQIGEIQASDSYELSNVREKDATETSRDAAGGDRQSTPSIENRSNERPRSSTGYAHSASQPQRHRKTALRSVETGLVEQAREIVPVSAIGRLLPPPLATRAQPAALPMGHSASERDVHVTIGRVEVRATVGQPKRAITRGASSHSALHALEDFLRGDKLRRSP